MSAWRADMENVPKDGSVVVLAGFDDGELIECHPMRWDPTGTNELFAPGTVGIWVSLRGDYTWAEGEHGPTHWRVR